MTGHGDAGWGEVVDAAVDLRRRLHRRPELRWEETETAATIRDELERAGIDHRPCAETGTVATLATDAPGRHVALRGDIDAMPITEASGVAWASEIDGRMHACGHDGHIATLIATARWLRRHENALPGPVTLLFQPAEEGGHGARRMIEDGALDDVDVIFGWHNWPSVGFGRAVCPDGPVLAANGTFRVEITGSGGHASQPQACRDPVLAAAAVTVALQQIVARRLAPQQAAVVSVTWIDAPGSDTVIPERARLGGSVRTTDTTQRDRVFELIDEIARATAEAHGTTAEVDCRTRYGATVNHPGPAAEMRAALEAGLGPGWEASSTPTPVMASEDFSYYLDAVPGSFALVGADDGRGHDSPCHSPTYDFNDRLIPLVSGVLTRLAGAPPPPDQPDPADRRPT